jgi:peptidoglycan/LPS O-acetylase OafA/YrhL
MIFDVGFIIRTSSAALYVLLGLAVVVVGRRKLGPVALGLLLICFGSYLFLNNFIQSARVEGPGYELANRWLLIGTGAAAVAVAATMPTPMVRRERWALAGGAAVGLALTGTFVAAGLFPPQTPLDWAAIILYTTGLPGALVALAFRLARTPPDRQGWLRTGGLLAAFSLFQAFVSPRDYALGSGWSLFATLLFTGALSAAWLVAASRSGIRRLAWFAMVWPALGLAGFAYFGALHGEDDYGAQGILRLIGWSALVYVILRAGLLGVPLPRFAVKRGTVAAGALAILFIVAQVAQNFFSAEYGLLSGGIIAGTFLFAASPIQKRIERMGERKPSERAPKPSAAKEQEAAYRDAVRLALRDRRFEADEELAIANLADRLGLTAMRAIEIRLAVEKERGLR